MTKLNLNLSLKNEPMQAEDVADDEETATDEGRILKRAKTFFCDSGVGDLKLSTV